MHRLVALTGALLVFRLGVLLHFLQQVVVVDVVGIIILDVAHRVELHEVGPAIVAEGAVVGGKKHPQAFLRRVVPELVHHAGGLGRVEVAKAWRHGQLACAAGQQHVAPLVVKGAVDGIDGRPVHGGRVDDDRLFGLGRRGPGREGQADTGYC